MCECLVVIFWGPTLQWKVEGRRSDMGCTFCTRYSRSSPIPTRFGTYESGSYGPTQRINTPPMALHGQLESDNEP